MVVSNSMCTNTHTFSWYGQRTSQRRVVPYRSMCGYCAQWAQASRLQQSLTPPASCDEATVVRAANPSPARSSNICICGWIWSNRKSHRAQLRQSHPPCLPPSNLHEQLQLTPSTIATSPAVSPSSPPHHPTLSITPAHHPHANNSRPRFMHTPISR